MRRATSSLAFALAFAALPTAALAGTPTFYTDRASFEAQFGTVITDDYSSSGYVFSQDNATMSAVFGQTDYESTGHIQWNLVPGGYYCAGCNGSFRLSFLTTTLSSATGVAGVGFDVFTNSPTAPYYAFVTYGDGTTSEFVLPASGSFVGITAPEQIASIHFGLSGGGATTGGSFGLDDLTIGGGYCGDGVVGPGEACDDGNDVDTDACLSTCVLASCGDGYLHAGVEQCDDANAIDTDACLSTCELASCGDGVVHAGHEACDDGNDDDTDACSNTCAVASCGDGIVQAGVEQCDDGNILNTDACLTTCLPASCGDGFLRIGVENCDDGPDNSDTAPDACRSTCERAACGDGVVDTGEACDGGPGCSATCTLESGAGGGGVGGGDTGSGGGDTGDGAGGGDDGGDEADGGCGCQLPGNGPGRNAVPTALVLGLATWLRRRRGAKGAPRKSA